MRLESEVGQAPVVLGRVPVHEAVEQAHAHAIPHLGAVGTQPELQLEHRPRPALALVHYSAPADLVPVVHGLSDQAQHEVLPVQVQGLRGKELARHQLGAAAVRGVLPLGLDALLEETEGLHHAAVDLALGVGPVVK